MNKREQVRKIIRGALSQTGDTGPFADGDSLVVSGRLSSLEVVNVLLSLEQTFGFEMDPDEFDLMKLDSVDSILDTLESG